MLKDYQQGKEGVCHQEKKRVQADMTNKLNPIQSNERVYIVKSLNYYINLYYIL